MRSYRASLAASAATAALLAGMGGAAAEPAPIYNWTGFYIGANAGYGWGEANNDRAGKFKDSGTQFGLHGGYNHQFGGIVVGFEADAAISNIDAGSDPFFEGKASLRLKAKQDWAGSLRLRAGLPFSAAPLFDNVMIYGTGGAAISRWNVRLDESFIVGDSEKRSKTYFGWTAGLGIEAKFNSSVSIRTEYLHADYGSETYSLLGEAIRVKFRTDTVRLGLTWHFPTPAPPP